MKTHVKADKEYEAFFMFAAAITFRLTAPLDKDATLRMAEHISLKAVEAENKKQRAWEALPPRPFYNF